MLNNASAWYVMVGLVDKIFDQNQAKDLFDSGKIKIRGPFTEEEMRKYYNTGILKAKNIILKKGHVTWKPVHSYDDNFIRSLIHNNVFSEEIRANEKTEKPQDLADNKTTQANPKESTRHQKTEDNVRSHKPFLYIVIGLLIVLASLYLYYDIYYCSPREFYKRNKKNIVIIYSEIDGKEKGLGSGFFISKPGLIVTNLHVIAGATTVKVKGGENNLFDVEKVVFIDPKNDLALIKVAEKGVPQGLDLGTPDDLQVGDKIFAIGNPAGLEFSLSEGIVSGIRNEDPITKQRRDMIQITASISPGNSGGPVMNRRGKVVGVATLASVTTLQNINFAAPISPIKQIKEFNSTAYKFLPSDPNWVNFSSKTTTDPSYVGYYYAQYTGSRFDAYYDTNSVADIDSSKKRLWCLVKGKVAVSTYGYYGQVSSDSATADNISLIELDCNSSKYRTNSQYLVVNNIVKENKADFSDTKEWLEVNPELKSQVCR